ncbi:hypothetical protein ACFOSV_14215 [Algoriphagus namhaensis]|uniref:Lipoprotein n=1 Tax=Algoriphagus namhaensis TaxID=915353 RepID=A0ABV8AUL6_9BACT
MKNTCFLILFFCLIFSACKEEEQPRLICGVTDPVASLDWLSLFTNEIDESYYGVYYYISHTQLDGQDVFVVQDCCPNCFNIPVVYACDGESLGFLSADAGINPAILDESTIIWKGTGFSCNL